MTSPANDEILVQLPVYFLFRSVAEVAGKPGFSGSLVLTVDGKRMLALFTDNDLATRFAGAAGLTGAVIGQFGAPADLLSYLDDQRAGGVELIAVDPGAVEQKTRYGSLADAIDAIRRGGRWKVASPG
jgi:hypothetical protein